MFELESRLARILRHTGAVFLLSLGAVSSACGSGEPELAPSDPPAQISQAVSNMGWWSLNSSNHNTLMDASTHLICSADPNPGMTANVNCYAPNASPYFESATVLATNWGTNSGANGHVIPGGGVKAVSILKRADLNPGAAKPGRANYEIHVLCEDNVVRYTFGDSDKFYQTYHFKDYYDFIYPTASDGTSLSFRKIMWMNEDDIGDDTYGPTLLWGLTYEGKLYYSDFWGSPWEYYDQGVRDMGRVSGRGATFLMTDGRVWYDSFASNLWAGWLPSFPSANIVAVGGLWALTDAGTGGRCTLTGCAGDANRVLHFDWTTFQWLPFGTALTQQGGWDLNAVGYYPIAAPQNCSACSPEVFGSIVDPHGFGTDNYYFDSTWRANQFAIGPLVGRYGQRMYFYNPRGDLPGQFQSCFTEWHADGSGGYYSESCQSQPCTQQENGTPCRSDGVCGGHSCWRCGHNGDPCCAGQTCPAGDGTMCNFYGSCSQCGGLGQICCAHGTCPLVMDGACGGDNRCYAL